MFTFFTTHRIQDKRKLKMSSKEMAEMGLTPVEVEQNWETRCWQKELTLVFNIDTNM